MNYIYTCVLFSLLLGGSCSPSNKQIEEDKSSIFEEIYKTYIQREIKTLNLPPLKNNDVRIWLNIGLEPEFMILFNQEKYSIYKTWSSYNYKNQRLEIDSFHVTNVYDNIDYHKLLKEVGVSITSPFESIHKYDSFGDGCIIHVESMINNELILSYYMCLMSNDTKEEERILKIVEGKQELSLLTFFAGCE